MCANFELCSGFRSKIPPAGSGRWAGERVAEATLARRASSSVAIYLNMYLKLINNNHNYQIFASRSRLRIGRLRFSVWRRRL